MLYPQWTATIPFWAKMPSLSCWIASLNFFWPLILYPAPQIHTKIQSNLHFENYFWNFCVKFGIKFCTKHGQAFFPVLLGDTEINHSLIKWISEPWNNKTITKIDKWCHQVTNWNIILVFCVPIFKILEFTVTWCWGLFAACCYPRQSTSTHCPAYLKSNWQ